ncbi:MAG: hypothetical protein IIZ67_03160 [Bacilli bacterium]|nr:hypothetical protein [Bacilli bacterium]
MAEFKKGIVTANYYGLFPMAVKEVDFKDKRARVSDYLREFFNRTTQMFKYEGLPETIPKRSLELMLQSYGDVAWYKHNDKLYVFRCGLGGEPNEYYMPTIATITNPYLKITENAKIDEDCIIMPNDTSYSGLYNLHSKYATLLAEIDITLLNCNYISRMPSLISAKDDKTNASAVKYLKDIVDGKLGIIGESAFLDGLKSQPYNSQANNVITQLIELKQYLKASWYNEIGLNSNYNMKRESINSNESQLNDDMLHPLIDDMLEQRKLALEKINKMFGTNISVSFNGAWEQNQKESELILDNMENQDTPQDDKVEETKEGGEENV